jgi:tRNA(Ile)-lysidine synthase
VEFSPERLSDALGDCLGRLSRPVRGLCVALSGGLDSTVLLAALARIRRDGRSTVLRAVHVDHGLHADSQRWAEACAALAASLQVPFELERADARPAPGESPEAAARRVRYAALARRLGADEVLLTAHHADDQLETVLLQWLRGGGLRAVAGMPRVAGFAAGWHARPLLEFPRIELEAWAERCGLGWLEDPSNLDLRFDRNYLRHEVMPVIRRRWPAAARTVGRVAGQAAEALEAEGAVAEADLESLGAGATLSLESLRSLPDARQRWALRAWLRRRGLPVPSASTLAALQHDMLEAAGDRIPCVSWPGVRVYRYRNMIHAERPESHADELVPSEWTVGSQLDLGSLGRLELRYAVGRGLSQARLPADLHVRRRARGEMFRPAGSSVRRPLRKWLQERGVLPWWRDRLPLVVAGDEIVAIGDLGYGAAFCAAPGEPSWQIVWHGRPQLTVSEPPAGD